MAAHSTRLTNPIPVAIKANDGARRRQGNRPSRWASRRLEVMAITTGKVPITMVVNGPPVRWMEAANSR